MSDAVLRSNWLPAFAKLPYGRLRNMFGLLMYRSRFCPARTSPTHIIALVLRRGDIYLDIGASRGAMVSLASAAVGSSGRVYAFEPRSSPFRWLQRMCDVYRLTNVRLFQSLVGDSNGETTFFENVDNPSSSSLALEWAGGIPKSYPMITLDEWSKENSIGRVDLIKVDVEGGELKVLQGGTHFLRRTRALIILEIHDPQVRQRCFGYDVSDLVDILRSIGYTEFYCLRQTGLALVEDMSDIQATDHDMLAFCPDALPDGRVINTLLRKY